jgi:hypothetical protein
MWRRSIPTAAWVIIVVEFFERMAYYATAFTLMTYCTDMLLLGSSQANLVVNILYVISPLSAVIGSGVADGALGRRNALLLFLAIYVVGVSVIALSTFPFMYDSFPTDPGSAAKALFMIGIGIFGVGYGGMKVCTSPLMADACVAHASSSRGAGSRESSSSSPSSSIALHEAGEGLDAPLRDPASPTTTEGEHTPTTTQEEKEEQRCRDSQRRASAPTRTFDRDEEAPSSSAEEQRLAVVSRLFRVMYWSINFGSLFGIIGAPILRSVRWGDGVNVGDRDGAAYYAGFSAAAVATCSGFLVFLVRLKDFADDAPPSSSTTNTTENNNSFRSKENGEKEASSLDKRSNDDGATPQQQSSPLVVSPEQPMPMCSVDEGLLLRGREAKQEW